MRKQIIGITVCILSLFLLSGCILYSNSSGASNTSNHPTDAEMDQFAASLDGSFAQTASGYFLTTDYSLAVHYFWQKEYEKAVNSHIFSYCYCHGCTGDNLYYSGRGLQVYMDKDVTPMNKSPNWKNC